MALLGRSTLDRTIARLLPAVPKPVVRRLSAPYIAGSTVDDAVRVVRALKWYEYSLRRLQESPKITGYIAADTVGRVIRRRAVH